MNEWKGNDRIFRTYLKGGGKDGKGCADKHKGVDHVRFFDEAARFNSFGAVLQNGFVDISFDSREMSDAFIEIANKKNWRCMVLENPTNGHIHTYWKDTQHRILKYSKDQTLAVGLVADIHGGDTYIPLKVNGVERFPPVYDLEADEADYQEVPDELMPVNTKIKLWQSKEGDGRNNDLYSYILILQSQLEMSADDIRQMYADCINPFILAEPLSDDELNVILRDESFDKIEMPSFYNGNTFLFEKFARFLKDNNHVIMINDQLHIYHNGVYVSARKYIEAQMIELIPMLRKAQRHEVLDYLELIAENKQMSEARYIAFTNGVYDIVTDTLMPFSADLIITNQIPWAYNPNAYSEVTDITLNRISCNDKDIRMLLEECVGACMYRSALLAGGKTFILTGGKSNGKSTFLDMIKKMLGDGNIAALDLKEISERFNTAMISGKLANIGDDIADDFLQGSQVSIFKKIVTGNRIKGEWKGKDPFEFNPFCKLLFSANDIPRMKDKTGAVQRRLVIIPFNAVFKKTDKGFDPFIIYKVTNQTAMEYLIMCGIRGLKRVLLSNKFTTCDKVEKQLEEYELENNPILGFINETGVENILHQPTSDVYTRYRIYCQECSMLPVTRDGFTKQINKRLNYQVIQKRIKGKIIRIFAEV